MTELATDKKDLSETIKVLTTRCRLLEQDRNREALRKAAPEALDKVPPTTPEIMSAPSSNSSPLETLIHLEVLKAVRGLSSPPAQSVPQTERNTKSDSDHLQNNLTEIDEKLQSIIENEKFLYERILEVNKSVNELNNKQPVPTPVLYCSSKSTYKTAS